MSEKKQVTKYDRYNAKASRYFSLKFNRSTDAELIEKLEQVGSINGYIRRLIREDIERSKGHS